MQQARLRCVHACGIDGSRHICATNVVRNSLGATPDHVRGRDRLISSTRRMDKIDSFSLPDMTAEVEVEPLMPSERLRRLYHEAGGCAEHGVRATPDFSLLRGHRSWCACLLSLLFAPRRGIYQSDNAFFYNHMIFHGFICVDPASLHSSRRIAGDYAAFPRRIRGSS